jgi:hypothetical protein
LPEHIPHPAKSLSGIQDHIAKPMPWQRQFSNRYLHRHPDYCTVNILTDCPLLAPHLLLLLLPPLKAPRLLLTSPIVTRPLRAAAAAAAWACCHPGW